MINLLEICSAEHPSDSSRVNCDFKIGNLKLSKHFDIEKHLASISVSRKYTKQLLLEQPSDFQSGRVPLYVCECCADLGCGALTVRVEKLEGKFIWYEFGYEGQTGEKISQSDYMKRTGPFYFDSVEYKSALTTYK